MKQPVTSKGLQIIAIIAMLAVAALLHVQRFGPYPDQMENLAVTKIRFFPYIQDTNMFRPEGSKYLSREAQEAVKMARAIIQVRLQAEISGNFSIAQSTWGYQVDFSGLEIKKDGVWTEVPEGFGEVFLDKGLSEIEICLGP